MIRSSEAPELVFIDPRVAFRLPNTKAAAAEDAAGGTDEPIGYIRQDIFEDKLRQAAGVDQEIIISIQAVGATLFGLSNLGRLFAHGVPLDAGNEPAVWHLITERELSP